MTLTAQERLDDPGLVEAADPGGVLRQVASAAAQVRTSARAMAATELGAVI
jgi:glucose/mannose-6-phosphate isomerase